MYQSVEITESKSKEIRNRDYMYFFMFARRIHHYYVILSKGHVDNSLAMHNSLVVTTLVLRSGGFV